MNYESETTSIENFIKLNVKNLPRKKYDKFRDKEQLETEAKCKRKFSENKNSFALKNGYHARFATNGLEDTLEHYFSTMDASRTWLCYWSVHTLRILKADIPNPHQIFSFLKHCYNQETGGFGGGPQQLSHLAPTYSATCCLIELDLPEIQTFFNEIRPSVEKFLKNMLQKDGSFLMHRNGETDTRAAFCAVSVAKNLDIDIDFSRTIDWLVSCQSYEGGISGVPGAEAHGGYTFCAVAALKLLNSLDAIDVKKCARWLSFRQMDIEGGFNGRTNKLVDACYSFWQGGAYLIVSKHLGVETGLTNETALCGYTLAGCQSRGGGLIDKPGKGPDYYHTCYGLSGYALTSYSENDRLEKIDELHNICKKFIK